MEKTELGARIKRVSMLVWMMTGATLMVGLTLTVMAMMPGNNERSQPLAEQDLIALIVGITGAIALISVSMLLFNRMLTRDTGVTKTLDERMQQYTTAYILRSALLEGAVLLNIILYFVYHQDTSLMIAGAPYALMFLQHPSADHFERTFPDQRRGNRTEP